MTLGLINRMHWNLNRRFNLLDEDPDLGSHAGSNGLGWLHDLDVGRVLFHVRPPPIPGLRVLVHFDHSA